MTTKNHLTNFLIDFYFDLFIEKYTDFQYFPSHEVTFKILSQKSKQFLKTIQFNRRFTILPVHIKHPIDEAKNHWCMIILDIELKYFYFLNSIDRTELNSHAEIQKYYTKFGFFLNELRNHQPESNLGTHDDWTSIETLEKNHQVDGYNCGIHIINFAQQFATHGQTFKNIKFNADLERKEIQKFILQNSILMESICLACGQEDEPGVPKNCNQKITTWSGCEECFRWFHIGCLERMLKQKIETKNFKNICPLCRSNTNRNKL